MTGQTNWSPYDVPQLAGILNDNLDTAWDQVFAWFNAQAMLDDASSTLAAARQGLADVWPPESSPAAQTFFKVVDDLTESMRQTSLASNTNASALANVLDNHVSTQSTIGQLHARWTMFQKLAYADPSGVGPADQWRSSLNAEAQQHMAAADAVIDEYAATLVVPPVISVPTSYDPGTVLPASDGTPASGGRSAGSAVTATSRSNTPERTQFGGRSLGGATAAGIVSVPVLTGGPAATRGGLATSTSTSGIPAVGLPSGPSAASDIYHVVPGPIAIPGGVGQPATGIGHGQAAGTVPLREGAVPVDAARDQGVLGADGTLRPAPRRGNASNPSEAEGFMPPIMSGAAAGGGERKRRTLAESIWHVPTGGPAVIAPAYEPSVHDPGPGVIGIDR